MNRRSVVWEQSDFRILARRQFCDESGVEKSSSENRSGRRDRDSGYER